jgi:hypothetical protein
MPLEKIFRPSSAYPMVRLGKNNDGGYLVGTKSLAESKTLITFGIKNDWSFESDFIKANNNIKVICFDNQLDFKFLLKLILRQLFLIFFNRNFSLLIFHIKNLLSFFKFKKRATLVKKHITYGDVLRITNEYNNVFFKIDIDGSEYRIFEELLQVKDKINGLVIELHDIDLHKQRIINFASKLGLDLIHIHPNNFAGVDNDGDPIVIEVTFEKNSNPLSEINSLPHNLDMPNNPFADDINIKFRE